MPQSTPLATHAADTVAQINGVHAQSSVISSAMAARTLIEEKVRSSAHEIWLAGLGALAQAQAEAEGEAFFRALVTQGEAIESSRKPIHS